MKNYFDCYDEFASESFDLMEVFVLHLYQKALATGMTKYEAQHAVLTFLMNRFNEKRYVQSMIDHAELINFVFPGVDSSENIHV